MTELKSEDFQIEGTSLKKFIGDAEIVRIPEGITTIGHSAFESTGIKEIFLPESVTTILYNAFAGCQSLSKISMPGVVNIGYRAFKNCYELVTVEASDKLETLGENIFESCKKLKEFKFSQNLKVVPPYCFINCESLNTVILPLKVKEIKDGAFKNTGLSELIIPNNTCKLSRYAFKDSKLTLKLLGPDFINYKTNGSCVKNVFVSLEETLKYYPDVYKKEKAALNLVQNFETSLVNTLKESNKQTSYTLYNQNGKTADIFIKCGKRYAFLTAPLDFTEKSKEFIRIFCDYSKTDSEVIDAMKSAKIKVRDTKVKDNMNLGGDENKEVILFCKQIIFFRPTAGITLDGCEKFTFTPCIQGIVKTSSSTFYYLRDKKEVFFPKGSPFIDEFRKSIEYDSKQPGITCNKNIIITEV